MVFVQVSGVQYTCYIKYVLVFLALAHVLYVINRYMFGGYTERPWQSTGNSWVKSKDVFVFRFDKNSEWSPVVVRPTQAGKMVCLHDLFLRAIKEVVII